MQAFYLAVGRNLPTIFMVQHHREHRLVHWTGAKDFKVIDTPIMPVPLIEAVRSALALSQSRLEEGPPSAGPGESFRVDCTPLRPTTWFDSPFEPLCPEQAWA
jgi:hypothetical protein